MNGSRARAGRRRRHGVGNGLPQSVRKEVGGSHLLYELLVNDPAATIGETLGLNQNARRHGVPVDTGT